MSPFCQILRNFCYFLFMVLKYYKEICNYKILLTAFDNIKYTMESFFIFLVHTSIRAFSVMIELLLFLFSTGFLLDSVYRIQLNKQLFSFVFLLLFTVCSHA